MNHQSSIYETKIIGLQTSSQHKNPWNKNSLILKDSYKAWNQHVIYIYMMIHIIKNKIKNKKLRDEIDLPEKIGGITLAFVFSKQENGIT